MNPDYIQIGRTGKTYGLQGALRLKLEDRYLQDLIDADVVFLLIEGQYLPYFIELIEEGPGYLLTLEDVSDKEAAQPLTGKAVFLRSQDVSEDLDMDTNPLMQLMGYTIYDTAIGSVAPIEDILELPEQLLAQISWQGRAVLIPLHDNLISTIDHAEKRLVMELPEGLLEL